MVRLDELAAQSDRNACNLKEARNDRCTLDSGKGTADADVQRLRAVRTGWRLLVIRHVRAGQGADEKKTCDDPVCRAFHMKFRRRSDPGLVESTRHGVGMSDARQACAALRRAPQPDHREFTRTRRYPRRAHPRCVPPTARRRASVSRSSVGRLTASSGCACRLWPTRHAATGERSRSAGLELPLRAHVHRPESLTHRVAL